MSTRDRRREGHVPRRDAAHEGGRVVGRAGVLRGVEEREALEGDHGRLMRGERVGKQVGGDIKSNKKTFLLIHALETASAEQKRQLLELLQRNDDKKVDEVLSIFKQCKVDEWANELKEKFITEALGHLEDVAVLSKRKEPLKKLALILTQRQN